MGFASGGYWPPAWGWSALAFLWAAALGLALRADVKVRLLDLVWVGAFAAALGWILLSLLWTASTTETPTRGARWQSGEMALRWTAAGMLEAEQQFRRVIGYRDLAKLSVAIERDIAGNAITSPTREEGVIVVST